MKRTSSVLVRTDDGHVLLDGLASLENALPEEWRSLSLAPPPRQPYDGHMRIRDHDAPDTTIDAEQHAANLRWMQDAIDRVREKWLSSGLPNCRASPRQHGSLTRALSTMEIDLAAIANEHWARQRSTPECRLPSATLDANDDKENIIEDLAGSARLNMSTRSALLRYRDASFLIPPRSGFLLTDLSLWHDTLAATSMYWDAVILDPPWSSKSVERSTQYRKMDDYDLFRVNLPSLLLRQAAEKPCLIVTWVTNNPKHRRFVRDRLYRDWGISSVVQWWWIKVTGSHDDADRNDGCLPVWHLKSRSPRRCYEGIHFGLALHLALHNLTRSCPRRPLHWLS